MPAPRTAASLLKSSPLYAALGQSLALQAVQAGLSCSRAACCPDYTSCAQPSVHATAFSRPLSRRHSLQAEQESRRVAAHNDRRMRILRAVQEWGVSVQEAMQHPMMPPAPGDSSIQCLHMHLRGQQRTLAHSIDRAAGSNQRTYHAKAAERWLPGSQCDIAAGVAKPDGAAAGKPS